MKSNTFRFYFKFLKKLGFQIQIIQTNQSKIQYLIYFKLQIKKIFKFISMIR